MCGPPLTLCPGVSGAADIDIWAPELLVLRFFAAASDPFDTDAVGLWDISLWCRGQDGVVDINCEQVEPRWAGQKARTVPGD